MKRVISWALFGFAAATLGGCPIYSEPSTHRVCSGSGCYDCPSSDFSDACTPWRCDTSADCPSGYACNELGRCGVYPPAPPSGVCTRPSDCGASATCGSDGRCHAEDCSVVSCPSGYVCLLSGGVARCTERGSIPGPIVDGGPDAPAPAQCATHAECASRGAGAKCLDGTCTVPRDQCTDATQCVSGSQCVDGVCIPSCGSGKPPCPTGYACDAARGVCTTNPSACTTSGQCTGGNVCVGQRCVAPCGDGGACGAGLTCVRGGCIPSERPTFACNADGRRPEGDQAECKAGSICLRRSCYITCSADAGADGGAGSCRAADTFNVCKPVEVGGASFAVCSSASGLGTECGPTTKACGQDKICIDGTCR